MKNKILLEIIIVLSVVYAGVRSFKKETSFFYHEDSPTVKVKDTQDNQIDTYPIEEYVLGVVAGEMPASFDEEALKAQAIAARTFAYYMISISNNEYDLTNDTTSQVHITNEQMKANWQDDYDFYLKKLEDVVKETKDMVMTYDGEVIASFYYSMSNGYTEDAQEVFGIQKDYLTMVASEEDTSNDNYEVVSVISKEEFCQKLGISCDDIIISDIKLTPSQRVSSLNINNQVYTGTEIRSLLNLRSTDFTITPLDNEVSITTKGFGHGVGMSQYGAEMMAEEGYSYKDILKHYYQNVEITDIKELTKT